MSSTVETPDLLAAIVASTRRMVEVRSARVSFAELERLAATVEPRGGVFMNAISATGRPNVIAEWGCCVVGADRADLLRR
jgi:hypothetical protein